MFSSFNFYLRGYGCHPARRLKRESILDSIVDVSSLIQVSLSKIKRGFLSQIIMVNIHQGTFTIQENKINS